MSVSSIIITTGTKNQANNNQITQFQALPDMHQLKQAKYPNYPQLSEHTLFWVYQDQNQK